MTDYYKVLGVSRKASQEEIENAYRKIVRENHPDLYPGDKEREERLKAANEAYQVLGNAEKRRQYDAGLNGSGRVRIADDPASPKHPPQHRGSRLSEVFATMITSGASTVHSPRNTGKSSVYYQLWISEAEARNGGVRRVQIDDQIVMVHIRPGAKDKDMTQIPVIIRIRK